MTRPRLVTSSLVLLASCVVGVSLALSAAARPNTPRPFECGLALDRAVAVGEGSRPSGDEPKSEAKAGLSTTVILLRHAEKATDGDARDPSLSEAGSRRAQSLAKLLAAARVTRLFASEYHRTQDTLAPLATAAGQHVELVPAGKMDELEKALRALPPGSVAVVAGHSNTVPDIARRLGVALPGLHTAKGGAATLGEDEFDRLFVLTLPPDEHDVAPSVVELRY